MSDSVAVDFIGSSNRTYEFDGGGERVFSCQRGGPHIHRGEYAMEDFYMCSCPHSEVILLPDEDSASCGMCGKEIQVIRK